MKLPDSQFEWLPDNQIESFDVQANSDDSDTVYVLEVDLSNPKHLHDFPSDYPLAPEKNGDNKRNALTSHEGIVDEFTVRQNLKTF